MNPDETPETTPLLAVVDDHYVFTDPDGGRFRMPLDTQPELIAELVNANAKPDPTGGSNPDHVSPPFTAADLIATSITLTANQAARVRAESERLLFECATQHGSRAHPFCPGCRSAILAEASLSHWVARNGGKPLPELTDAAAGPTLTSLTGMLDEPDEPTSFLMHQLWPVGGNVMLAAQYKTGKSTMVANIVRSLVDGDRFLRAYDVTRRCSVALLDDELDERNLRRWLRDQRIESTEAVSVASLRGRLSSFNILDPSTRSAWAAVLRGHDVIVLDCLRPVLDALGLSEDKEAGRFLVAFDALVREAGATESLVVHHAGHGSERSRGDSRLLDWPDVTWTLMRESDDPSSARFFKAFGRDVDHPETGLTFDPATRRLTLRDGSRKTAARDRALDALLELLDENGGPMSANEIEKHFQADEGNSRKAVRDAIAYGLRTTRIIAEDGPRNAILHRRNPYFAREFASSPEFAATPGEVVPTTSPPPYSGEVGKVAANGDADRPSGAVVDGLPINHSFIDPDEPTGEAHLDPNEPTGDAYLDTARALVARSAAEERASGGGRP
jgi:AAA domain